MEKLIKELEKLGYKQQDREVYCSFKIVVNNCRDTEYYFRKPKHSNEALNEQEEKDDGK